MSFDWERAHPWQDFEVHGNLDEDEADHHHPKKLSPLHQEVLSLGKRHSNGAVNCSPVFDAKQSDQVSLSESRIICRGYFYLRGKKGLVSKTHCPIGLRGWTQVPLARAAWVQIPQVSFDLHTPYYAMRQQPRLISVKNTIHVRSSDRPSISTLVQSLPVIVNLPHNRVLSLVAWSGGDLIHLTAH